MSRRKKTRLNDYCQNHDVSSSDFEKAAQSHANAFWIWLIIAIIAAFFIKWFALIPGVIAIFTAIKSAFATKYAEDLKKKE